MDKKLNNPVLMAIAILNHNDGAPFVKEAIKLGLAGGFISPAAGLIGSPLLNLLSIRHDRRDLVVMFEKEDVMMPALDTLVKRFKMDLPNHGVLFVMETCFKLRRDQYLVENDWNKTDSDYHLVFMSCKHGKSNDIIAKINQVSTAGATIFTGKGDHASERQQMMGMNFSPQKDMIISIVESDQVPDIFEAIESNYHCSQTKGMYVYSLEIQSFSQNKTNHLPVTRADKELLVSIVSEELEEDYLKIMKKHQMNGGTSLKGHGSVSPEMMERIFNITVNPQKKILLTVDSTEKVEAAYQDILNTESLIKKHQGVYLTIPLRCSYGMFKNN